MSRSSRCRAAEAGTELCGGGFVGHLGLADVFDLAGRDSASIEIYREAAATLEAALGEEHRATLRTLNNLAVSLRQVGREAEAEEVLRRILEIRMRRAGIWDREVASTMQNLAAVLRGQGEMDEALELLSQAHRVYVIVLPEGHHLAAFPLLTRSSIELDRGDYAAAASTARDALDILSAALSDEHPVTAMARCRLGRALLGLGQYADAERELQAAVPIVAEATRLPDEYRAECLTGLANVLEATGRDAEARPYRTATAELESTSGE